MIRIEIVSLSNNIRSTVRIAGINIPGFIRDCEIGQDFKVTRIKPFISKMV